MAGVASAVRKVLARHPAERSELIPILQEVQDKIGYLPQEALRLVAHNLHRLCFHITKSRRILNDLRTLRRLLLEERSLKEPAQVSRAAGAD